MARKRTACTHCDVPPCKPCARKFQKMDDKNERRNADLEAARAKAREEYAKDGKKRESIYKWFHSLHPVKRAERAAKHYGAPWAPGQTERVIQMWDSAQDCPICDRPFSADRAKCVDHDHVTGLVRGVVCRKCNSGLGMFEDNQSAIRAAANYMVSDMDYVWDMVV